MDKIYLRGLQCECVIGVWEWERHIKQQLVLDLELETDISAAAKSDDLKDALNYQRVAERVKELTSQSQYALLESLVDALATMILAEFNVLSVTIRIDKGSAVTNVKNVGIEIKRLKA